jgi:hypothetical protein
MSTLTITRFKTGYFKNLAIQPQEWYEAKARAVAQPENAMAFIAPIFEQSRQQVSGISTVTSLGSPSNCTCGGANSSMRTIYSPPYSPYTKQQALDGL